METNNIDHKIDHLYELMRWREKEVEDLQRRVKNKKQKLQELSGPLFGVGETSYEEEDRREEAKDVQSIIYNLKNQITHQTEFIQHHIEVISWLEEIKYENNG